MFRPASQSLLRQSIPAIRRAPYRHFLSTAPPAQRSRSWRNSAVRWGLAVAGVYYYNTSTLFAEEPTFLPPQTSEETVPLPTISSLSPSSRRADSAQKDTSPQVTTLDTTTPQGPSSDATPLSETEEEASQQGAFNEETGEINWDCPCLGGMAHGPCGPEFRAAFSCFVYSKEEPKGMDCIENFKGMQDCFRQHPEVYGSELDEDGEDELGEGQGERIGVNEGFEKQEGGIEVIGNRKGEDVGAGAVENSVADRAIVEKPAVQSRESIVSESEKLVPKTAHDATNAPTKDEKN